MPRRFPADELNILPVGMLVRAAAAGDDASFEELVRRYYGQVRRQIVGFFHSDNDADDLCQETFLKAWRKISTFREDASFSTWLYRLTENLCKDELRKRGRIPPAASLDDPETSAADLRDISDIDQPEEALLRKDSAEALRRALDLLDPDDRMLLLLHETGGLSYAEIAERMHLQPGTVSSRMTRTRQKLKKWLSDREEKP